MAFVSGNVVKRFWLLLLDYHLRKELFSVFLFKFF